MPTITESFNQYGAKFRSVSDAELAQLAAEREDLLGRARAAELTEDVDSALEETERIYDLSVMLGDSEAATNARDRYAKLTHERNMRAKRHAEDAIAYEERLDAAIGTALSIAEGYATLSDLIMEPSDVRPAGRAALTPTDIDGDSTTIGMREASERHAIELCADLISRCDAAVEALEKPRPRGLAEKFAAMMREVKAVAERDADVARANLATLEAERQRRTTAERDAELAADPAAMLMDMQRRLCELETAIGR